MFGKDLSAFLSSRGLISLLVMKLYVNISKSSRLAFFTLQLLFIYISSSPYFIFYQSQNLLSGTKLKLAKFLILSYFIYTSHHFTPHGRYVLNKLGSLPTCGFIAQLVEHRTGIAEVTGSNPVEALSFSGFFFPIA